jgi:radical SAM superfamily enzyme YgiQ (UPF0313 family)
MFQKDYILAINPWIYDFTAYDLWMKPYGLLSTAGFLMAYGYRVHLMDCLDRKHHLLNGYIQLNPKLESDGRGKFIREIIPKPKALKGILRRFKRYGIPYHLVEKYLDKIPRPSAVLITSQMTYWYPGVSDMAELVRKIFPGVPLILGGIYPSIYPEDAVTRIAPDFICIKDDLFGLLRFIDSIFKKDRTLPNGRPDFIEWNNPDYSLIQDKTALPILTSVGCPYACPFCMTNQRWGSFRFMPPDKMAERILKLHEEYHVRHFAFYDDALLYRKKENIFRIFKEVNSANADLFFHTPNGLSPRGLDKETSVLFRNAGFRTIRLSYESSSDVLQKKMKKVSNMDLITALDNLESEGYERKKIEVYLIAGLPDQQPANIVESMKFINDIGARIHLAYYSPIRGTPSGNETISKFFPKDYDPLLTNKFAFVQWHPEIGWDEFEYLREMKKELNDSL